MESTIAEREHRSEFGKSLEGCRVDRIGDGKDDHQQKYRLQKAELPIEKLDSLRVEIRELLPGEDLVPFARQICLGPLGYDVGKRRIPQLEDDLVDAARAQQLLR